MARVTALRPARRQGWINLFLDGRFALKVSAQVVSERGIQVDQELDDQQVSQLSSSDTYRRCLTAASSFLSYRPRSVSEIRTRLSRQGFAEDVRESVIEQLKANGLLNDAEFALFWATNRETFSPRSRRLTQIELRSKGISPDDFKEALATIDDEESAYRAASERSRSTRWADRNQFRSRLGAYLQRRGFAYGVIDSALKRVWKEIEQERNIGATGTQIENT